MRFGGFDRWSVRFVGSLAAIAIGVPAVTFGSVAYWDELTSSDIAEATNPACSPARSTHVANGTRYIVEQFTTVGTCDWAVPADVTEVDVLVVGGGGGGGNRIGGGGGGGGVVESSDVAVSGTVTVVVGDGGTGGQGNTAASIVGGVGGQSDFGAVTAPGGGGGAGDTQSPKTSSSATPGGGGGGGGWAGSLTLNEQTPGGTGSPGGSGGSSLTASITAPIVVAAGGGGGGGYVDGILERGGNGTASRGGAGGRGTDSSITGTTLTYGGGGGGGVHTGSTGASSPTGGVGGLGGGGAAATRGSAAGAGADGLGGGGGGGFVDTSETNQTPGADGGSGIVVVRYEVPGSDRDWAFSNDLSDIYFQTSSNVNYLYPTNRVGTVEAWTLFEPTIDTYYDLLGASDDMFIGTWGQNRNYEIRFGNGWSTGVPMPQNRWTHVAVSWRPNSDPTKVDAELIIDGAVAATREALPAPTDDSPDLSRFRVGAMQDADGTADIPWASRWSGKIDEVRIWGATRSADTVSASMHSTLTGSEPGLIAYWDFNQSAGSTVTALGSAGDAATLRAVGTPAYTELAAGNPGSGSRSHWTVHRFDRSYITAAGGWTVPAGVQAAEVLVVGGGGGGGARVGAGGGAGGFIEQSVTLSSSPVEVTVGSGGSGAGMSSALVVSPYATDGSSSSFGAVVADGGGRGASNVTDSGTLYGHEAGPTSGNGSAGGGSRNVAPGTAGSAGNAGGAGRNTEPGLGAGGGGGAGGSGTAASASASGVGGPGRASSISGSPVTYAGGGGGSSLSATGGAGGSGGGGAGASPAANSAGLDGLAGTGSGGGGGASLGNPATGGNGGSGVVIVAYLTDPTARITDGLVVDLDVVNPNSHQGASTTWNDLAGGDDNALFNSAPTITDGDATTPDRVALAGLSAGDWASITGDLGDFTDGITIRVVGSFGATTDTWERLVDIGNGQEDANLFFGREAGTDRVTVKQHAPSPDGGGLTNCISTTGAIDGSVHVWTATIDAAGDCALYKDDVQLGLDTATPGAVSDAARGTTYIGKSHWAVDADTEGSIRSVQIYDRALTRPELLAMSTATAWVPTGAGDITIVTSGGADEGSGWTLRDGRITSGVSAVSINASEIATALASGDLKVDTTGSITIDSDISWSAAGSVLLLTAGDDIEIAADVTASGSSSGLVIDADGDWWIDTGSGANVTLTGTDPVLTIDGETFDVISSTAEFAAMTLSGRYALADSLAVTGAARTAALRTGAFTGTFEGLGNTISGLTIESSGGDGQYPLGLFTELRGATIRHLGITDVDIQTTSTNAGTGDNTALTGTANGSEFRIGALAGNVGQSDITTGHSSAAYTTTISRVWSTGSISTADVSATDDAVSGDRQKYFFAGGLLGSVNNGTLRLSTSYSEVNVSSAGSFSRNLALGGLIGDIGLNRQVATPHTLTTSSSVETSITTSYTTGSVVMGQKGAYFAAGGLVGVVFGSGQSLSDSFSWSNVVGSGSSGGIAGYNGSTSYATTSYTTLPTPGDGSFAATTYHSVTPTSPTSGTSLPTGFSATVWAKSTGERPYLTALGYPAQPIYVLVTDNQTEIAGSLSIDYTLVDSTGTLVDLAALGLTTPTGTPVFTIDDATPDGSYEVSYLSGLTLGGVNAARFSLRPSTVTGTITIESAPGQPTGLRATPSGSSATSVVLTWSAPTSGATPTGYRIEYSTDGGSSWSDPVDVSTATTATVTALVSERYYTFRVTALAGSEAGTPSATSSTTTGLIPFPNASNIGTGAATGFSYLYEDVLTGVDARLTATNVTVSGSGSVEVDTSALDGVFTDGDFINTRLNRSSSDHHVTYRIDFVDASTGDPVTLENVIISVRDLDGSGSIREYLEVAGITSYTLQRSPDIAVSQPADGTYRFSGTAQQNSEPAPKGWAQVTYDSVSSVTVKVGNTEGYGARIPIAFGPAPFTDPLTTNVTRPTYTIIYDANGGSGTVPTPTAGNAALTIADGSGLTNGSRTFIRWNTEDDGSGSSFSPGASYTPSGDLTLYAVYQRLAAVSWNPSTAATLADSPLSPDAAPTYSGSGALTFSVADAGTTGCTVDAATGELTFAAIGSCVVRASVAAGGDFAADSVDVTFVISPDPQSISFNPTFPTTTYGDSPFSVQAVAEAAGAANGRLVTFSSAIPAVCTVTGDASVTSNITYAVVTPVGAGSCTIEASQAGDSRYAAATLVSRSFTIAKAAQAALSFTSASSATWGDTVTATISGGSGTGAVSFGAAAGTAGCTIDATTGAVTFTSAGTCTLTANKAGDDNHLAATALTQTLTIAEAAQTVTFTSSVPASPLPAGTYTVTASATSGLTPALSVTTGQTTVCTLSAGVVTFLATGTCTITATQAGDTRFAAAAAQTQTIAVGSLNQSITVTVPDDTEYGTPAFTLDTSASSGLTVTVTPADTDICTVTGLVVTPVDIGDCDLTVTQTGDSRYAAASPVAISFRVIPALPTAPTITSVSAGNADITVAFTAPGFTGGVTLSAYTITATPASGPAITDTTCAASPCTISGLTNGTGYTITITANNTAGAGPASTASPSVTPATKATAVTRLAATPTDSALTLSWGRPTSFGGGTFTRYEIRVRAVGDAWPVAATATVTSSTATTTSITNLQNGVAYEVEVVTVTTANLAAIAGNTATLSSVPVARPSEPADLTVNIVSPRVVRLTWAEPVRDGGAPVTGYTVTITSPAGTVECGTITLDTTTRAADCTSDTLMLSTDYTISVAAVNRIGAGPVATISHTTPTFTAPTTPPVITSEDTDPDPCPCVYDADGNPVPVDIDRTAPGATPGQITIGDGSSTITIGGSPGSSGSDSSMWVDADGQLIVRPPTALPLDGSGALPGTTVTVFINGVAAGTATVDADGNWTLELDLPAGTTGPLEITTVWIDADGNQQTLTLPVDVYTPPTTPPTVTIDDDTTCPCVFDADGNPIPVDIDRTPTGTTPGTMTIGGGTITLGGTGTSSGTGQATTWIDADGRFTAHTPGTIPLSGADALPGTTVTIFWNGVAIGTTTVNPDGTWSLDLDLPAGTNGPGTLTIIWTDTTGAQRTLSTPMTIIATGDAATAPRAPTGGTQLAPDPDTAIALGPNGERLDTTRTPNPATNTITITVGDTALTVTPVEGGRVGTDGRLNVTHPARIRVTGNGMLPGATATIWVMSTPQRLGTITINTDGTIDTTYTLPTTIDPGNHTIQIDSVALTGQAISIALGFTISAGLLPTTGAHTDTHLAWLTLLLALGGFITLTTTGSRRRRVS